MTKKSTVALAIKSNQFLNLSHWQFLAIMIGKTNIVSFALQMKSTKQSEKKWKGAAGPPIWYAYFELYLYFTKSIVNQMISINIWLLWYHSIYAYLLAPHFPIGFIIYMFLAPQVLQ